MQAVYPASPANVPSVVEEPKATENRGPSNLILRMASLGDGLPAWGTDVVRRDAELRKLWLREPLLKSIVISTAIRYAKLPYTLDATQAPKMANVYNQILQNVDRQRGWIHMWTKVVIDALTQDNGGIIEIIRLEDSPVSPMVSLRHLDSSRCRRTGDPEAPIKYFDQHDKPHLLMYYQVTDLTEAPMPVEEGYDIQLCAVSRIFEAAQIMRDIRRFKSEKIGGRWNRSIHIISGIAQSLIDDMMEQQSTRADAAGLLHYLSPLILASHQAEHPVSHEEIELASLPDGFDEEQTFRQYVIECANAFLLDPLDIAPLESGHLGTGTQADVLAQKGRSKGPDLFMSKVEHIMNYRGVLPKTVPFKYMNQDTATDTETTNINWRRAQIVSMLMGKADAQGNFVGGVITPQVAAQMLRDWGLLKDEYLEMMGMKDTTPAPVQA